MSTLRPQPRPAPPRSLSQTVERLYVYWTISTVLLLMLSIVPIILLRAAQLRQTRQAQEHAAALAGRVEDLERRLAEQSDEIAALRRPAAQRPAGPTPATRPAAPATRPAAPTSAPTPPQAPPAATVATRLEQALRLDNVYDFVLADRAQADALLRDALSQIAAARWDAATWGRLAIVARLLDNDAAADSFLRRADGWAQRSDYDELAARMFLARGRVADALAATARLTERPHASATARALAAAANAAADQPARTGELLDSIARVESLPARDKLVLGRVCVSLQRWDRLHELMQSVQTVPTGMEAERDFLRAAAMIHRGESPAALAMLDYLSAAAPPVVSPGRPDWQIPRPDRYDIDVWRGVALLSTGQWESGRAALQSAAERNAARPDAHYWRGVLEMRAGRSDDAAVFLQNALATSARLAPAWELLGVIALNGGDAAAAADSLARAVEIDPTRAAAQLLYGLASAKLERREAAEQAVRAALSRDPALLDEALQSEALVDLVGEAAIREMAGQPASAPATDEGRE